MRRIAKTSSQPSLSFNPRICKRCDRKDEILSNPSLVSIHASVKDATSVYAYDVSYPDVSIHASVKDATGTFRVKWTGSLFQSTHL